jgi:RNA polymerase sigma-70 factor (ECF subfamily)
MSPHSLTDHVDRLYRAAWAMCGSREDAEDLVQETFARVLAKQREIKGHDPVPYLLCVLRNTFISSLRTKARRPQTTELSGDEPWAAAPGSSSPPEALAAREVFAAIAALKAEYRDVVVAIDVAGLSYQEAAKSFSVPVGTVMSRLSRGRGQIATALGD